MAKAKPTVDPVRAALKSALDNYANPLPLIGAKGKGLFAKAQSADAERAVAEGWLTKRVQRIEVPPGKGKNAKPKFVSETFGILTEAGARKLAETSETQELKPVLEAIRNAVGKLGEPAPALNPAEFSSAVEAATGTCVAAINTAFDRLRGEVLAALPSTATNPAPIYTAIEAALTKLQPTIMRVPLIEAPTSPPAPQLSPAPTTPPITEEIVAFVNDWARLRTVGPPFDEIMKHLRARHPNLSVGAFHDALRKLSSGHPARLKLSGWPKTLNELPEPELALFVKHTVTYYAHPNQ